MQTFFGGPAPRPEYAAQAVKFAQVMRRVPRRALRCDVYGTVSAVVDRAHALNILRKAIPGLRASETYDALVVLQSRLDEVSP